MSKTILIVEDDVQVRDLLKLVLSAAGFELIEAEDGTRGLTMLRKHRGRVAAILTDVDMGRMNGIEFGELAREQFPEVPILFLSALPVPSAELQRAVPGSTFVSKPFDSAALVQTVRGLVEKP